MRTADSEHVAQDPKRPIPVLDGWRCIAILLVIVGHSRGNLLSVADQARLVAPISAFGALGVDIFFALSGYLICSRLAEEWRQTGTIRLREFYARRFFRLYPAIVVFLAVACAIAAAIDIPMTGSEVVASLLFARNYTGGSWVTDHLWSLAIEEHFYLIFPALLLFAGGPSKRALGVSLAFIAAVIVWRTCDQAFIHSLASVNQYGPWRTDYRLDSLLWGCAFALGYGPTRAVVRPIERLVALAVPAVLLVLLFARAPFSEEWRPFLIAAMVATSVQAAGWGVFRLWDLRPVRWVGRISYSLYLWQELFLAPLAEIRGQWFFMMPWNLVVILALATMSYYLVERPSIALGRRLVAR